MDIQSIEKSFEENDKRLKKLEGEFVVMETKLIYIQKQNWALIVILAGFFVKSFF